MLKNILRGALAAVVLAFGQPAAAQQSPYFTFVLDVVDAGAAPYLRCFEERTCDRATRLANGNMLARQVYEDVTSGQMPVHQGPVEYFFNVWRISGRGLDRVYIDDAQGRRVVHAQTGCTHTTSARDLGGPPQACFHVVGRGSRISITFVREVFVLGSSAASWCDPNVANAVRPTKDEGIPYVPEELRDKLNGLGGFSDQTVTFALVRGGGYALSPTVAQAPAYGYQQPQPAYAAHRQSTGRHATFGPSPGPSR
jgi:hypothetical protein